MLQLIMALSTQSLQVKPWQDSSQLSATVVVVTASLEVVVDTVVVVLEEVVVVVLEEVVVVVVEEVVVVVVVVVTTELVVVEPEPSLPQLQMMVTVDAACLVLLSMYVLNFNTPPEVTRQPATWHQPHNIPVRTETSNATKTGIIRTCVVFDICTAVVDEAPTATAPTSHSS